MSEKKKKPQKATKLYDEDVENDFIACGIDLIEFKKNSMKTMEVVKSLKKGQNPVAVIAASVAKNMAPEETIFMCAKLMFAQMAGEVVQKAMLDKHDFDNSSTQMSPEHNISPLGKPGKE